jgi:hypothetical protein
MHSNDNKIILTSCIVSKILGTRRINVLHHFVCAWIKLE